MRITDDILYVGVNDHNIDLFEGQYIVPNGMAYNSYVINDEKIAVMDTVDAAFGDEWLKNIADVLNGATPDYLIWMEESRIISLSSTWSRIIQQIFRNFWKYIRI